MFLVAGAAPVRRVHLYDNVQQPVPEERGRVVLLHRPIAHHRLQRPLHLPHPGSVARDGASFCFLD